MVSRISCHSALFEGGAFSAIKHRRTSEIAIVPSLVSKSAKASWISASSSALMSFSFASLERRFVAGFAAVAWLAGCLRLGGYGRELAIAGQFSSYCSLPYRLRCHRIVKRICSDVCVCSSHVLKPGVTFDMAAGRLID